MCGFQPLSVFCIRIIMIFIASLRFAILRGQSVCFSFYSARLNWKRKRLFCSSGFVVFDFLSLLTISAVQVGTSSRTELDSRRELFGNVFLWTLFSMPFASRTTRIILTASWRIVALVVQSCCSCARWVSRSTFFALTIHSFHECDHQAEIHGCQNVVYPKDLRSFQRSRGDAPLVSYIFIVWTSLWRSHDCREYEKNAFENEEQTGSKASVLFL